MSVPGTNLIECAVCGSIVGGMGEQVMVCGQPGCYDSLADFSFAELRALVLDLVAERDDLLEAQ